MTAKIRQQGLKFMSENRVCNDKNDRKKNPEMTEKLRLNSDI